MHNVFNRLGIAFNLRCKLKACNGNFKQNKTLKQTNKRVNLKLEKDVLLSPAEEVFAQLIIKQICD